MVLNTPGDTMARPEVMARIRELSQAADDDLSPERVRARLEWLMADSASVTDEELTSLEQHERFNHLVRGFLAEQ